MKKVLLLMLSISLFSCSKEGGSSSETPTNSITYFKANLNGTALNYHEDNYTSPTHMSSYTNGYQADRSYYYGCMLMPSTNAPGVMHPEIDLTFENMISTVGTTTSETDAFYSAFNTIPTNFITSTENDNLIKGISVNYQSPDGKYYSTQDGSQSGSTMTVTSATSGIEPGGSLKIETVIGTVSCKLYNDINPSDVITLTNGQYKLIFREFN